MLPLELDDKTLGEDPKVKPPFELGNEEDWDEAPKGACIKGVVWVSALLSFVVLPEEELPPPPLPPPNGLLLFEGGIPPNPPQPDIIDTL